MVHGAEALLERLGETDDRSGARAGEAVDPATLLFRNRVAGSRPDAVDRLVRRLAADHLRELRDDGVTLAYIARMYGVSTERMERLYEALVPSPPR